MLPWYPVKPIRGGYPFDDLYLELEADPRWICQAKLDGRRALWDGAVLWSTESNQIWSEAARMLSHCAPGVQLDGEHIGECFYAFDIPSCGSDPYGLRWRELCALLAPACGSGIVELCPTDVCWSDVRAHGWEGVVFKRLSAPYKRGTSPNQTVASWVKYRAEWSRP